MLSPGRSLGRLFRQLSVLRQRLFELLFHFEGIGGGARPKFPQRMPVALAPEEKSASGKACRHTRGLMYATECRLAGRSLREHEGRPSVAILRPSVFEVRWRLDPKTGAFKEYRTKTPDSGPHGLAADKDGNIWFAASFQGYTGKHRMLT
jgi:hypothetical protein